MNRLLLILTILVLIWLPYSALPQGTWKYYSRADGLAGDSVACIAQDKSGNYWFGTLAAGLSKLDTNGVWTNYFPASEDCLIYISDIEIDSLNNKWLVYSHLENPFYGGRGTFVVKFDDSTFTYYSPAGNPKYDPKPRCLGQDSSGHIWCGMTYGVAYWFDGINWNFVEIIPPFDWSHISEIKMDRQRVLYFAHDQGISVMKERPNWIWAGAVTSDLTFDKQNRLWFTMRYESQGLGMFDGSNWYYWSKSNGLLKDDVWAVAIDSSNNIWFSYYELLGVAKFDGSKFTHFSEDDGLANNLVWDIFVDKDRNIWFATHGGGISVLRDTTITSVSQSKECTDFKENFNIFQNYPNPFNLSTTIRYNLIREAKIELSIYNLIGKEVGKIINEDQQAGLHQVTWNSKDKTGKEVSSGIYIAVLKCGSFKKSIKLTLIR